MAELILTYLFIGAIYASIAYAVNEATRDPYFSKEMNFIQLAVIAVLWPVSICYDIILMSSKIYYRRK
jgi:hypothetical protein